LMDIFSLPDVFLRKLMKNVEIKDRLRLRLTCRSFNNLVANTHAGYFDSAGLHIYENTFTVCIGDAKFKVPFTAEAIELFILLRSRIFNGIALKHFLYWLNGNIFPLEEYREFTNNFNVEELSISVSRENELVK
ncbi:hypothetical protein PENTCL1PPCAC_20499, partial [Pristionchus entomophagus]